MISEAEEFAREVEKDVEYHKVQRLLEPGYKVLVDPDTARKIDAIESVESEVSANSDGMTEEQILDAIDEGVADKIKFLDDCRAAFIKKNQLRFNEWLKYSDPDIQMLPFHQDNNTGVCTWLNRKARRG